MMEQPSVVLVEDYGPHADQERRAVEQLSEKEKKDHGIEAPECELFTASVPAAERLRPTSGSPVDILIVDLSLPLEVGQPHDKPEYGIELLRLVKKLGAARRIIVVTNSDDATWVRAALDCRVAYYVQKEKLENDEFKVNEPALREAFLDAWDEIVDDRADAILAKRDRQLARHMHLSSFEQSGEILSRYMSSVYRAREDLESELSGRLGINVEADPENSLARPVLKLRAATKEAQEAWDLQAHELRRGSSPLGKERTNVSIMQILDRLREELEPCFISRRVQLESAVGNEFALFTYEEDFYEVVKEIILGGMKDMDRREGAEVTVILRDGNLALIDDMTKAKSDSEKELEALAADDASRPLAEFGRAWGLYQCRVILSRFSHRLRVHREGGKTVVTLEM